MKKMYSSNTELINSETIFFFFSSKKYTLYTAWNPAIRILFNVDWKYFTMFTCKNYVSQYRCVSFYETLK